MFRRVHPFEMLRAVARSHRGSPGEIAAEAAWGLAILAYDEPAALVPACRRLLERQPACGPLWWLAARVLVAGEPAAEADACTTLLEEDPTRDLMYEELSASDPDAPIVRRRGSVEELAVADAMIVEAWAISPEGMFVPKSNRAILAQSVSSGIPVWVEAGVGRLLPPKLWRALADRVEAGAGGHDVDQTRGEPGLSHFSSGHPLVHSSSDGAIEPLDGVDAVFGPNGRIDVASLASAIAREGCPEPPELTAGW
jgi:hypothetical protein